jgi:hypothetical protein
MEDFLQMLGDSLVYVIIGACVVTAIITKGITTVVVQSARERSRREIAAYIAEGSLTAEHGERLLKADMSSGAGSCCEE